ncbi:hypothetical protein PanWU01x14_080720, partial [Parasponia andersonii]
MEGVVVGEATNDKEKETMADSIGANNEEADRLACVSNEEFKQPHDRYAVEQHNDASKHCIQSENRVHVDKEDENVKVRKDEEHQDIEMESCANFVNSLDSDTIDDVIRSAFVTKNMDESKAIALYIGSGSKCKLVEFTP